MLRLRSGGQGGGRDRRRYWLFVALFLALAAALFYARPPVLQQLRHLAFDAYQRLSPAPPVQNSPIVVVAIDEASLARLGQWPWPRSTVAELTDKLGQAGAAAIVFDVMFAEPDRTSPEQMLAWLPPQRSQSLRGLIAAWPTHDGQLAEAFARNPVVLAATLHHGAGSAAFPRKSGFAAAGDDPAPFLPGFGGVTPALPELTEAARGVGFVNWLPDRDQVVRRVHLLARHGDTPAPSLALEALRVAQGASTYIVRSSNAHGATAFGQRTGVNKVRVGALSVATDANAAIWLHFRRSEPQRYISAARVLEGGVDPDAIAGAIVLVGATAPGLMDLRATPLDDAIPGVEVHQQALEQMVAGRALVRPDYAGAVELLTAVLAVLLLAFAAQRVSAAVGALLGLAATAVIAAAGLLLFTQAGYLFDPVFPAGSAFVFSAGSAAYLYRQAERQRAEIRRAFSQYVAPSIVRELTQHPERLKLGGEVRDLTVLVCDVRNFTRIAEGMSAEQTTAFINSLLTPLTDIVLEAGGTIDKYMGDAIMAFWNAPLDDAEHARHACEAALRMSAKMRELNRAWRAEAARAASDFADVAIGIGVNSGECCVGNLGSERHFDYSAIGDTVNIASRLESLTKAYGLTLLVGEDTALRAPALAWLEVDLVRLKGRSAPSRVFTLFAEAIDANPEHGRFLEAYRAARWAEAGALLARLRERAPAPLQRLYEVYAQRLERLAALGPENWDGVYELQEK